MRIGIFQKPARRDPIIGCDVINDNAVLFDMQGRITDKYPATTDTR
jgi:hypothetical protein